MSGHGIAKCPVYEEDNSVDGFDDEQLKDGQAAKCQVDLRKVSNPGLNRTQLLALASKEDKPNKSNVVVPKTIKINHDDVVDFPINRIKNYITPISPLRQVKNYPGIDYFCQFYFGL